MAKKHPNPPPAPSDNPTSLSTMSSPPMKTQTTPSQHAEPVQANTTLLVRTTEHQALLHIKVHITTGKRQEEPQEPPKQAQAAPDEPTSPENTTTTREFGQKPSKLLKISFVPIVWHHKIITNSVPSSGKDPPCLYHFTFNLKFQHIFSTYNFDLVLIYFPCFVPFTTPHITYYRSSLHILKYSGLLLFLHVFFLLCFCSFSGNDTVKDTSTSGERDQGWLA